MIPKGHFVGSKAVVATLQLRPVLAGGEYDNHLPFELIARGLRITTIQPNRGCEALN